MKKVKITFWVLLIAFFGLLIFQNQELFLSQQGLRINLYFTGYHVPEVPNAVYHAAFFLIGFLFSYFLSLAERFKSNKIIKELKAAADAHLQKVPELQGQSDPGRQPSAAPVSQPAEPVS